MVSLLRQKIDLSYIATLSIANRPAWNFTHVEARIGIVLLKIADCLVKYHDTETPGLISDIMNELLIANTLYCTRQRVISRSLGLYVRPCRSDLEE